MRMFHIVLLACAVQAAAAEAATTVMVSSTPRGATMSVDGEVKGKTPMTVRLNAGRYSLRIERDGYEAHEQILLVGRKLVRLNIELERMKVPVDVIFKSQEHVDWLAVVDGSMVLDGGRPVLIPATLSLPIGRHKMRLMKADFEDIVLGIDVQANMEAITLDDPRQGRSTMRLAVSHIRYMPRSGWAARMVGGEFEGSNAGPNGPWTLLATVETTPIDNEWVVVELEQPFIYRWLRYVSPRNSHGNVAEIEFYCDSGKTKLRGIPFGTAGSYNNSGEDYRKAFDGSPSTCFNHYDYWGRPVTGIDTQIKFDR